MTNFSGKNLNVACDGPKGGGMDCRHNALEQTVPEGYKQTEVGVIPENWKVSKLGNIGKFKNGINKDADSFGYGLPFINLMDVFGKSYISGKEKLGLINSTEVERKEYNVKESDVLFIRSSVKPSGVGLTSVALQDLNDAVYSGFLIRYRSNEDLTKDFKKHCFYDNGFRNRLIAASTVSANTNINQDALKDLQVAYPSSTKEQTAITNALSDVDSLLTELEKLVAKKQAIKTATMQQLLTGKTRLPQFATYTEGEKQGQPKGIKTSELGEIPEDWEVHSLSSLCDVRDGTHDSPKYKDNGIPLVTSKNIVDDILDLSNVSFISSEDAFEIDKRSKVDRGDIIMSMIGTVGSAVLVLEDPEFCIKNVALFKPKKVSGEFLVQLIRSKVFQDYLEDSMDGGIQKFVSLGTLRNMEVVLPCDAEQTAIANILSDMDNEIQTLEQRLAKTRQIKQGMMQELLTGRTRLPFKKLETEQDGGS